MRITPANKARAKERFMDEMRKYLWMVGYVWIVLVLLELHRAAVLRQYNVGHTLDYRVGFALLNALILAKFLLTAEALHVAEGFKDRALIYLIAFRSAVFSIILIACDVLEEVLVGMFHGKTFTQSLPMLGGGGLEGILIVGAIAFIALIPLYGYREFARIIGEGELHSLLFKRRKTLASSQAGPITKAG